MYTATPKGLIEYNFKKSIGFDHAEIKEYFGNFV
jgi:hypothetical protein